MKKRFYRTSRKRKYYNYSTPQPPPPTLISLGISSLTPPYHLINGLSYTHEILEGIELLLDKSGEPPFRAESQECDISLINHLGDDQLMEIADAFKAKRNRRIQILNSPDARSLELKILELKRNLFDELQNLKKFYSDYAVHRKRKMSKFYKFWQENFSRVKWIRIKNIEDAKRELFGTFFGREKDGLYSEYAYMTSYTFQRKDALFDEIRDRSVIALTQYQKALSLYFDLFSEISADIRADNFLSTFISGDISLSIRRSSIKNLSSRIKNLDYLRSRNQQIKLIQDRLKCGDMHFGGNTYLYYIRVNYGKRKKPFYKIGITSRSIKERYPGSEYSKISKVLFCEKVVDAEAIEKQIKILFEDHSIPLDFFRNSDGKTEFFDQDVLQLDH